MTQAKAQNRNSISQKPDQSLPRKKILRGKRNFQRLFQRSTVLKHSPLLCRYRVYPDPDSQCLFGFIAPKNIFRNAVDRNRAKRLLRESFRINQHLLPAAIRNNEIGFHAVFIATGKNLTFSNVEQSMISLLKLLSARFSPDSISGARNKHYKKD